MFSIDKADSWRQAERIDVSTALDGFAGHLRKVGDLRDVGMGATDAVQRLVQDVQDIIN